MRATRRDEGKIDAMRIVCVSDTHGRGRELEVPGGDVLIHAGDLTGVGSLAQLTKEADWLRSLPHATKIVIAGNHDFGLQQDPSTSRAALHGLVYLEDEATTVDGLTVWGSPWTPWFHDWAFNLDRGAPLRAKWDLVPAGIDVLVTHGPPQGILDRTTDGRAVGCEELLVAVARIRPRLHVFGHIHEAYGVLDQGGTRFVNASSCDARYQPIHRPVIVDR